MNSGQKYILNYEPTLSINRSYQGPVLCIM